MNEIPEVVVARSLSQADNEMQVALDAFARARRFRFRELFRSANTDPEFKGGEEVHVGYGVDAVLKAERHVAAAYAGLHSMEQANPARNSLEQSITRLDTTFRTLFVDLQRKPSPSRIVRHLKRARRAIPQGVVRRYTQD